MPPHPHCHWRGAADWKSLGLELSTTSDEACKQFDALLTQIVNHYDDETVGGAAGCIEKMFKADPEFLMGHVVKLGVSGQLVHKDPSFAQDIYKMASLAQQPHVKLWERKHAHAVQKLCEGKPSQAASIWEDILVDKPTDIISLKFLHDMYIMNGLSYGLRDSLARVQPYWKPQLPFYGDVLGMYAFGLEETNMYSEAEKTAKMALDINRYDAWATHCVAHVCEMTGRFKDGIKFMMDTENDWNDNGLQCHNYWHTALFHTESGDFESAYGILDKHIIPFMNKNKSMFSLTDAASLCFRLEAEGYDVGNRWLDCYNTSKDHVEDTVWSYFDINTMISCLGAKKTSDCDNLISQLKHVIKENIGENAAIYRDITLPICEALQAYDDSNFDLAVEIMKPLKYHIHRVGGSHAQRDLFNLFAIHAALRSSKPENQKYARHLLMERKSQKETPLADRLLQRLVDAHGSS
ncbi:Tetratricopeptide repeat protein 38 [Mactra antiquata]